MNQKLTYYLPALMLFFFLKPNVGLGQLKVFGLEDSTPTKIGKRFFPALAGNFGSNFIINRIDADYRKVYWGQVTPTTWKTNLKVGFQPDYDHFTTNWLGHPSHGSLFYNAARSNGYNYWESIPFTIGGSLIWEYFGETCYPSEIDLFTTSFGGVYVGELTHRFSEAIKYRVKNAIFKKTAISILNPISQLNSLIFKKNIYAQSIPFNPAIRTKLAIGTTYPFGNMKENPFGTRGYLGTSMVYGDLFDNTDRKYKPFDFFVFKSWINVSLKGTDSIFFNVSSHAPLLVKRLSDNSVISLSQHYDHLASDIYKIGSIAFTGDYSFQHYWNRSDKMVGSIKAGVILFGSSKSEIVNFIYHSDDPEFQRDYVYGRGFTGEAEILLKSNKYGKLSSNINRWVIYTDRDARGTEDLLLLIAEYNYPVWGRLNLGLQFNYYHRLASYDDYVDFLFKKRAYYELKTLLTMTF
jgi:Domain of unknown function (DUF3943)